MQLLIVLRMTTSPKSARNLGICVSTGFATSWHTKNTTFFGKLREPCMLITSPSIIQSRIIAKHVQTTYAITSTSSLQKRTKRSLRPRSCCEGVLLWVARAPPKSTWGQWPPDNSLCTGRIIKLYYHISIHHSIQFCVIQYQLWYRIDHSHPWNNGGQSNRI